MNENEVKQIQDKFKIALDEVSKVIVGQKHLIKSLALGLLVDGHLLLEGLPGLAKTLSATTFAQVIDCECKRIQFTPDLLPADLIGTSIFNAAQGTFSVRKGPIFTHILIADEINRAPAKVQSALLEVMQERQVTIFGQTYPLSSPFLVVATQNPIEHEGTYPLPEAQTDRFFMKIQVNYPDIKEEKEMLSKIESCQNASVQPKLTPFDIEQGQKAVKEIYLDDKIKDYILNIIQATRFPDQVEEELKSFLLFGASPRGTIALMRAAKGHAFLAGRNFVSPHDVQAVAPDVLNHRLRRTYEAEAEGITSQMIVEKLLKKVVIP